MLFCTLALPTELWRNIERNTRLGVCFVLASPYLPGPSPAKYFRHH
nr:MAG TPA: hypothetical protein [Caudoviricetes sp.]